MKKVLFVVVICIFTNIFGCVGTYAANGTIYDYDFTAAQPFNTDTVCSIEDTADEFYGNALKISTDASQNTGRAIYGECRGINVQKEKLIISFDCMPMQTDTSFSFISWNQDSNVDFRVNLMNGMLYTTNDSQTSEKLPYIPNKWYSVDILLDYTEHTVTSFFNGKNTGCFPMKNSNSNMLSAFFAGVWQQGTSGSCYLDNLKIYDASVYSDTDASVRCVSADKTIIKFNESIDSSCIENIVNNTEIINIENGASVNIKSIDVTGASIKITSQNSYSKNEEYAIILPENIRCISGHAIGNNIYNFVSNYDGIPEIDMILGSIDFENGSIGENISLAEKNTPDFCFVDGTNGSKVIKYTAQSRTDGKNTELDFCISGDSINKRKIIVTYDFMLGQKDSFAFRHTINDSKNKQIFNSIFNAQNKMLVFSYPNLYPDYKTCYNSKTTNYGKDIEVSGLEWHKAVIEFDRTGITDSFSGTTTVYIDGKSTGTFNTPNINGYSDVLDKIIFSDISQRANGSVSWGSHAGDVLYIDNIRVGYPAQDKVSKVNAFKENQKIPFNFEKIPADIDGFEIEFSNGINLADINKANITLYSGENCVDFEIGDYKINDNKLILTLPNGLSSDSEYLLNIKNVRNSYGESIREYQTKLKTYGNTQQSDSILNTHLKEIKYLNNTVLINGDYTSAETPLTIELKQGNNIIGTKHVISDENDKHFSADFVAEEGIYSLYVTGLDKTEIFKITAADIIKPFTARTSCTRIGNIFYDPSGIAFNINIADVAFGNSAYEIEYEIMRGNNLVDKKTDCYTLPKGTNSINVVIDLSENMYKYGIYNIQFKIKDKTSNILYVCSSRFSCVNAPENVNGIHKLGFSNHFNTDFENRGTEYMQLQKRIGASYTREEISWYDFEKEDGVYALTENRKNWLQSAKNAGIKPFVILAYSNKRITEENPPQSETALNRFGQYVYNLVLQASQYGANDFEVWNEYNLNVFNPDGASPEAYANLLRTAYTEAKKANPNCIIYGMAAANLPSETNNGYGTLEWIESVLEAGGGNYMDAVSVHPYPYSDTISPESSNAAELINRIRELLTEYNINIPVVASEYGWTSKESYPNADKRQARYNVRAAAMTYDLLDYVIWYQISEITGSASSDYGFIKSPDSEIPYEAKETYAAMSNFVKLAGEKTLMNKVCDNGVYKYIFGENNDLYMLWTDDINTEYSLSTRYNAVIVYDMYGNSEILTSTDGTYLLALTGEPVYIKPAADVSYVSNGKVIKKIDEAGNDIDIEVGNQSREKYNVYTAKYNRGFLTYLQKYDCRNSITVTLRKDNSDTIKTFVWSDNSIPVLPAAVLN